MILLDENIIAPEREKLRQYKITFRQISVEIGKQGLKDLNDLNDILPLLHQLKKATFFTLDEDFYRADWRHQSYALAYLDVFPEQTAEYVRRFLKQSSFRTKSKRMGKVFHIGYGGIRYWEINKPNVIKADWE